MLRSLPRLRDLLLVATTRVAACVQPLSEAAEFLVADVTVEPGGGGVVVDAPGSLNSFDSFDKMFAPLFKHSGGFRQRRSARLGRKTR
jgi:hypothetical protein